jgi:propanol-preferring alcohol dehydrogenase
VKELTSGIGAHAVIVTAGSERAYEQAPKLLRSLGTVVCVGLPRRDFHVPVSPFEIVVRGEQHWYYACKGKFVNQSDWAFLGLNVVGTSVGVEDDMASLLQMAVKGEVSPHVQVFDFGDINDVMKKLADFEIQGRAVLRIPKWKQELDGTIVLEVTTL